MATQQSTQPMIVHLEYDAPLLVPETTHSDEPTCTENNNKKLGKDITKLCKAEAAPSCMDAYGSGPEPYFMSFPSPGQDIDNLDSSQAVDSCHDKEEETLQQVLDRVYETKIAELKHELKECRASAAWKDKDNKTFKAELLNWINRWKEMNIKKNQYKKEKKSMIDTNQHLLEKGEQQKLVIIRLKARLSEARRMINLQSRT